MALPDWNQYESVKEAIDNTRHVVNGLQDLTDPEFASRLTTSTTQVVEEQVPGIVPTVGDSLYAPPVNAVRDILARIKAGINDVSICLVSDSTAQMTTPNVSWANQLDVAFHARFPTHTIVLKRWNASTQVYDTISTTPGSGPRTITIWNGGASSKNWDYQADSTRSAAMIAATNCDLMILSHGHNEYGSGFADNTHYRLRDRALSMIETYRTLAPSAAVLVMSQNPELSNVGLSEKRADIYRRICAERGYGFLDVCQAFHDDGRPLTDLVRNVTGDYIHPTAIGYTLWLDLLMSLFRQGGEMQPGRVVNPAFYDLGTNLTPVALAANMTGVNCTLADSTAHFETGTSAVLLTKTATGSAGEAYFTMPAKMLAGKEVTFAARLWIPTTLKNIGGRVKVTDGVTSPALVADVPWDNLVDQWTWRILTAKIAPTATTVRLYVAGDSSFADPLASGVWVDRVVTTYGRIPGDAIA